jgi:hypothetical protein
MVILENSIHIEKIPWDSMKLLRKEYFSRSSFEFIWIKANPKEF